MTEHRPYHERSVDQQMLDALLRIEVLLTPTVIEGPAEPEFDVMATADIGKGGNPSVSHKAPQQQRGRKR